MPMVKRTVTTDRPAPFKRVKKTTRRRSSESIKRSEIKKVLNTMLEKKHAITDYANVNIRASIPTGVVSNAASNSNNNSFFKILPEIDQSTTGEAGKGYNTRVGNEITLRSLDIKGMLSYNGDLVNQIDLKDAKLAVRVMILRAKDINDTDILFNNMPTDELIISGQQVGGGTTAGPISFGGFGVDAFRAINRDVFSVKYDQVHYLDAPVGIAGTSLAGDSAFSVVPSAAKLFQHRLTFGEGGLKLHYSSITDNMANNFPYFMVIGYQSMSASGGAPSNNLVRTSFSCHSTYTDS